jgi:hypothetical protein
MSVREKELEDVLRALLTNPHLDLGDLVYDVREREGEGWDGPSVNAWGNAVTKAKALVGL